MWPVHPIKSVALGIFDGPHATPKRRESGPVFLGISSLDRGRIDLAKSDHVSEADFAKWTRRVTPGEGDLVFSYETRIGEAASIPRGLRCCLGRRMGLVRPDPAKMDARFLLYSYLGPEFQEVLRERTVQGSTVERILLTELPEFPIRVPPLDEQRRIATVLGALDDKIELNRKMNRTLEEMAQAIFKSWFIDFDGHDDLVDSEIGPVPRGWEVRSLDAIADFLNGAACQKYPATDGEPWLPVIKIRELNQGVTAQTDRATATIPDKWHVRDGDVLFSWSGSLVVKVWTGGPGALNQHLFKVTSEPYPRWFYLSWVQHHLAEFQRIAADKATTMGHIKRHHLTDAKCAVPPADLLARVGALLEPVVNRQVANELESRTLADMRDTLLPKLISGELRVPEAEEAVGAASGPLSQYAAGEATAP